MVPATREDVAAALEKPWHFEPLRRALTPDDHVAIVIDETLPGLGDALAAVLEHLSTAAVAADFITIISPNPASKQEWIDDLPDEYADVKTEVHHPGDRKRLAYLASTKDEDRLLMNRTVVDADFVIVIGKHDGLPPEALLVPGLCDAEYIASHRPTKKHDWSEAMWLIGTPFFVRVLDGGEVLCGLTDSRAEADRRTA